MLAKLNNHPVRIATLTAVIFALMVLLVILSPKIVQAHGKQLSLSVTSLTPDPERPLLRLYRVYAVFASNFEPINGATVTMEALRQEGGSSIDPVRLTEVQDQPGVYVGEITFPRFGGWQVSINIDAAFGLREGGTQFLDKISPVNISEGEAAAMARNAERVQRLQVFFQFGLWPDVANIVVRVVHSLSALSYLVITGGLLFMAWLGIPAAWPNLPSSLRRFFLPGTLASLAALGLTGLYSAAFDTPVAAPGMYSLGAILALPYGEVYVGAWVVKPLAWLALVYLAFSMHRGLKQSDLIPSGPISNMAGGASATELPRATLAPSVRRLSTINAGIGLVMVADLALVLYLHYVSHLGVFLPSS